MSRHNNQLRELNKEAAMLYLATNHGIICADRKEKWLVTGRALAGHSVTCVAARMNLVLAGTMEGIFRSDDGGGTWVPVKVGPAIQHLRWIDIGVDESSGALAGTEPASIFHSEDRGQTWQPCPEVTALRDQFGWSLPYSPEAGCVRGFALHGARAYAAVEVGGVLASDDSGRTWQLVPGSDGNPDFRRPPAPHIHPDVHSILIHPSSPNKVFAPTGGGFYRSEDGGATWDFLYDCYCRAAWVDPVDSDHIVLGPARGVNTGGRIEESRDGGKSWHAASGDLAVPWADNMIERFHQVGDELLAVLSDGSLLSTQLHGFSWQFILTEVNQINAVTSSER
jgi:photosystem II stability/assembly factor-like uncharacterized protein